MNSLRKIVGYSALLLLCNQNDARDTRSKPQPVFLASIPKCGSHLIKKCLGIVDRCQFNYCSGSFFNAQERDFRGHSTVFSHAPYNPQLGQLVIDYNYKGILMIRDPRDQAVSFTHFAQKSTKLWPNLRSLPFEDLLTTWISDARIIKGAGKFNDPMIDSIGTIADFFNRYLPWMDHPNFYTVRFENLVGAKGGGNDELQRQEILNIAAHLGITLSDELLQKTIDSLFGRSRTFRKGEIGSWKEIFTPEQKQLFKEVAGDLLIHLGYEKDYNW